MYLAFIFLLHLFVHPTTPQFTLIVISHPYGMLYAQGEASHYGDCIVNRPGCSPDGTQGLPTSSGEIFDTHKATCASRTIPNGTRIHVINLSNNRSADCLVNDYGPNAWTHRVLDVSAKVEQEIGMNGLAHVQIYIEGKEKDMRIAKI